MNKKYGKHIATTRLQTFALSVVISGAILSQNTLAGDAQEAGVYLAPSLGYLTHSSNKQAADNDLSASIALGYQWASPWAAELAYTMSNPDSTVFPGDVDSEQLRLDALYHFGKSENWQPYFVFGAGESDMSFSVGSMDETLLNAGLGLKYAFNDVTSLRTDIRTLYGTETDASEAAFNLGFQFLLGKSSSKAAAKTPAKEIDSDGDGVADAKDRCPSTPKGSNVDASGCERVKDTDGDGVVDAKDQCPDTEKGASVTETGCYKVLEQDVSISLNVQFANNSDVVVSENLDQIRALAKFMQQYPETVVEIAGHTDDRGAAAYNKQLSQKRAEAVARLLVQNYSLDAARVKAVGYGEEKPIADNSSAEGRAKNRRVEGVVRATVEKIVK